MSIWDMKNKTKTYIAGDWTGDNDAVKKLMEWNEGNKWSLHFIDVHSLTQSYDTSLPCSIKHSLRQRMSISKTFILIVGDKTNSVTKGECRYCTNYRTYYTMPPKCASGLSLDSRSFVKFECDLAVSEPRNIIVLYNSTTVDKSKCPVVLREKGVHVAMKTFKYNGFNFYEDWDYKAVKDAIM